MTDLQELNTKTLIKFILILHFVLPSKAQKIKHEVLF
jgi:hypothetical protein